MSKLLFTLIFLTACTLAGVAQTGRADETAVSAAVAGLANAQLAYDAAALDRLLAPDYIEISPVGEFDPREKVLGFYTPEAKAKAGGMTRAISTAEDSVRIYGDVAVVIATLTYNLTNDGRALPPRSIRATFVLRKAGKDWRFVSAQYTGIRPPQGSVAPSK